MQCTVGASLAQPGSVLAREAETHLSVVGKHSELAVLENPSDVCLGIPFRSSPPPEAELSPELKQLATACPLRPDPALLEPATKPSLNAVKL